MKKIKIIILCLPLIFGQWIQAQPQIISTTSQNLETPNSVTVKPKKIQIVFCLDVTGSMQGLIATAKQKIWSIASSLLQADPKPELELGAIFYRDRGDKFITQKVDLTQNIDALYARLMEMIADGGGDTPESVNQALWEAINSIQWSKDTSVYQAVFLVGDCPPHMNYPDDVKYPVTCRQAVSKGIIINTLKMGSCDGAEAAWKEIALITGGDYIPVDQSANGYVVATPYDTEISKLQNTIDNTVVYYGTFTIRSGKESEKTTANTIYKNGKAGESASRAEYKYSKGAKSDAYYKHDLVSDMVSGKIKVDTVKTELLPDNMRSMTLNEKSIYITNMKVVRDSVQYKLDDTIVKRNEYLKTKAASEISTSSNSFNTNLYKTMQKQTVKKGMVLKGTVKE